MKNLNHPVKITVCCDGFVSIIRPGKEKTDRRLKAGIVCYSSPSLEHALTLISRVCILRCCEHGGKTGTLIEPWAPNWPLHGGGEVDDIGRLNEVFALADKPTTDKPSAVQEKCDGCVSCDMERRLERNAKAPKQS